MDGVLVVDKPPGPTSHDVVARVRRALAFRKIGHTGTLDPMATGVLPLVIGRATRLARFMTQADKGYDAVLRLGITTDTYDATGARTTLPELAQADSATAARAVTTDAIERALDGFRGTYPQRPPPFSAKKREGERAYRRARRGEAVVMPPVQVTVRRLELDEHEGDRVRLLVDCTAGFYVRSLAHDLGRALGCGAHLEALRRVRSGSFTLDDAVALGDVEERPELAQARIVPLRALLPGLPGFTLSRRGTERVSHGQDVGPRDLAGHEQPNTAGGDPDSGEMVRLLAEDGALVAIAVRRAPAGVLHPVVVLR